MSPEEEEEEEEPPARLRGVARPRGERVPRPPDWWPRCFVCRVENQVAGEVRVRAAVTPGAGVRCALCSHFFHSDCYVAHLQLDFVEKAFFCRRAREEFPPWNPEDGGGEVWEIPDSALLQSGQ